ncbi:hypothetical protein LTR37_014601 [Vermiconidia calcicola]|uniref:Uncharacterized protein n=1 Tax=Vermiconidia calcicola TaxID=1690605 RepID=A0ACC3MT78_9PEZI|nr:hypothetical protein LTR37_014601 [Vermiconidia calcicola]
MAQQGESTFPSRSSHRKSRLGCCDETRPTCVNCAKRSLRCAYTTALPPPSPRPADDVVTSNSPSGETFGSSHLAPYPAERYATPSSLSSPVPPLQSTSFDTLDLKLLHHYCTEVGYEFAKEGRNSTKWTHSIPTIAFETPVVLHGLLALSALHLARKIGQTDHAKLFECRERAAYHHTLALPAMIRSLPQLNESDTSAVFVGATLLCFHNFAAGPQPGQYIGFSDQGEGEWMRLMRGVRSISESRRPDALNDWMRHGQAVDTLHSHHGGDTHSRLPCEATQQLARLRRFAARMRAKDETYAKYTVAVESLENCFIDTFSTDPESSDDTPATQLIFTWLYRIPSEFVVSLQDRRPLALVIFAYFDVLLYQLRHLWYMDGWCEHVMSGIYKHLHVDYRDWLEWPAAVLQWSPPASDSTPGISYL